jgi:predicted heme/steroid binding protein
MKKVFIVFLLVMLLVGCSAQPAEESTEGDQMPEDLPEFTLEEIEQYNGQAGMEAYVVIDNVVYDVSNVDAWDGGMHNGHEAGNELSEEITNAPHGKSVLSDLPKVGVIKE